MPVEYKDYYKTLGVSKDATAADIKKAYRKFARQYHPDVNKSTDASRKFKEVNEANEVLSDPEKRKRYDQLGPDWERYAHGAQGAQRGGPGGGFQWVYTTPGANPFEGDSDFSDFFQSVFGGNVAGFGQTVAQLIDPAVVFRHGRGHLDDRGVSGREQGRSYELSSAAIGARGQLVHGVQRDGVVAIRASECSGPRNIARRPSFHLGAQSPCYGLCRLAELSNSARKSYPVRQTLDKDSGRRTPWFATVKFR